MILWFIHQKFEPGIPLYCQEKVVKLSKEQQEKTKDLPEDVKKAITDYVEATLLAADHDCLYLYEQGAKDCVALLKKLGVL